MASILILINTIYLIEFDELRMLMYWFFLHSRNYIDWFVYRVLKHRLRLRDQLYNIYVLNHLQSYGTSVRQLYLKPCLVWKNDLHLFRTDYRINRIPTATIFGQTFLTYWPNSWLPGPFPWFKTKKIGWINRR